MDEDLANRAVEAAAIGESFSGDMSMWGLFMRADIIVKLVMLSLVVLSVWCWGIIFEKRSMLAKLHRKAARFEDAFWSGEALDKLYQRVKKSKNDPLLNLFSSGMEEWQTGIEGGLPAKENLQAGLRQRVERAMSVTISKEMDKLERGMTLLASVGSTAPFIGLFGTVWGIMNSFSEIAMTNNTSIAVVAPGIAEALFTTALGLVAAIPANIAFNVYSSELNRYSEKLESFTSEFLTILSRYMDRHGASK